MLGKTSLLIVLAVVLSFIARSQTQQKIFFDRADSTNGYYLAIPPASGDIRATLVLFCPFRNPESILPETRLSNIAAASGILTIYASIGTKFILDQQQLDRMDRMFAHVLSNFKADSSLFAVGGFDLAGLTLLRYTEMAWEHPDKHALRPKMIFAIASFTDLADFYRISERQIKKNFFPPAMEDAKFFLDQMNKTLGTLDEHPDHYAEASPFNIGSITPGHEQFLRNVAIRLYYDTDIEWQLKYRRNGYYDTNLPGGAELIDRLLLAGNTRAEFIASKQPGIRSNGVRSPFAYSIVDETECIQWIKKELHIFDPAAPFAYTPPYTFDIPQNYRIERTSFPPPFALGIKLKGIEEIRFPPGWGTAGKDDYWSLAYLYWLNAGQNIDADVLRETLTTYFDGLVIRGGGPVPHNIPPDKLIPTKVNIQKIRTESDDAATWSGTIDMLDYMAMKPIRLNFLAHMKSCTGQKHTAVFVEASPKAYTDPLWTDLKKMKQNFKCGE